MSQKTSGEPQRARKPQWLPSGEPQRAHGQWLPEPEWIRIKECMNGSLKTIYIYVNKRKYTHTQIIFYIYIYIYHIETCSGHMIEKKEETVNHRMKLMRC